MKKILNLLLTLFLFTLTSCTDYDDPTTMLIISPYVVSEDVTDPNNFDENTFFSYEPLELNEVRLMAPTSGAGLWNLNILFEYEDGIIEVISDDVQISVGAYSSPFYDLDDGNIRSYGDRTFGYSFSVDESGYMSFYPIGSCYGYHDLDEKIIAARFDRPETGHEYYVTVNAYKNLNLDYPTATAVLKFVLLEDKSLFSTTASVSRFFSIELVSYK